jgi:transposase-like protein
MTPPANTERYKHHCLSGEIIRHGVWLYYRFTPSYRDVQKPLFKRGIDVTYEAIRTRLTWVSLAQQESASGVACMPTCGTL